MNNEIVLITGANGVVAQQLAKQLSQEYTVRFLTRKKRKKNEYEWDFNRGYIDIEALKGVQYIIHLAGASIAEKRWTQKRKQLIYDSRVKTAALILRYLKENNIKIKGYISASATGFYGTITSDKIFTENDTLGTDFLSSICEKWENTATKFTTENISQRTVILRFGIILSKKGGALEKMAQPVQLFLGAPLGTGKQYIPWIHINDLCGIIRFSLKNETMKGIYNTVAPESATNSIFIRTIAKVLQKPILMPRVPKFIIKLFFGEMSVILLEGSRVSAKKILTQGYNFQFAKLEDALKNLIQKS